MSPTLKNADPKAWIQEIKGNRKLQVGLVSIPVLLFLLWPSSPAPVVKRPAGTTAAAPLSDRQSQELKKLPDLAKLDKAGELPADDHMYRDIFLFAGPPPPPPPPPKPLPPPPPPTPEQLAAEQLRRSRDTENASRPQNLRYIGYLGNRSSGKLGAFMKGEEPISIKQGELANPQWRLVKLTENSAEFQNLKYQDLHHRIDAVDQQAGSSNNSAPANQF